MTKSRRASEVGLHFLTTAAQVRKAVDEHMALEGVSLARTKVLQVLARLGPVKQTQLAAELGMAARSITQAVEAMARDGLVRRSIFRRLSSDQLAALDEILAVVQP
ncbi:MarR family winged helix-turn-helix transcriptional regulator [Lentzea sp. NPDC054927]